MEFILYIYIQYCALYSVHHWEYILFVNIVLIHRGTSYNMFGNHVFEIKKSVWKRISKTFEGKHLICINGFN